MKKKTLKSSRRHSGSSTASEEPTCEYHCHSGRWVLTGMTGGPGYECNVYLSGICTNDDQTFVPASYVGGLVAKAGAAVMSLPKNSGEYIYLKGSKSIRLIRGGCAKGKFLQSEIPVKDLAKIDPKVADFLKAAAKQKVTSVQIVVAAQRVVTKK